MANPCEGPSVLLRPTSENGCMVGERASLGKALRSVRSFRAQLESAISNFSCFGFQSQLSCLKVIGVILRLFVHAL